MAPTVEILVPTGTVQQVAALRRNRVADLNGLRVAVLENGKPNFHRFAESLLARMQVNYQIGELSFHRKGNPSVGARPEVLDRIAQSADLVITGSAD